ncbi:MAG: glycosyltransferase [Prevotellaceae bacterium]|nr:glycosyltransferase [Prevotellaceae bacterium]
MKISIVTVTYNAESTIRRTMESVASQTYSDTEHIIIDGASKDRTVDIAKEYNATILSEPDRGLYDAMNKAFNLVTGDYICFLNAGDTLHSPFTLAHIAQAVSSATASTADPNSFPAVIYGDTDIVDSDGNFLRPRHLTPPDNLTWRSFQQGMLVCHQAFYVNRRIAQSYDTSYRFSADFDWCIRCMKEGEKKGMHNIYIKEPLADYLSEGMTTANHKASLLERFRIMCRHYGLLSTIANHIYFVFRAIFRHIKPILQ